MEKVLIAGLFTLIGAILSGLISRYGLPVFRRKQVLKCTGTGRDINLKDDVPEFEDNLIYEYNVSDCTIIKTKSKVRIKCHITSKKNGETVTWELKGHGQIFDGVAYCFYEDKLHDKQISWNGLLALSFSVGGRILGFWITENTKLRGKMAFGVLELQVN
ncbi:MAG: hypothetical protein GF313_05805 [Caldithrix sp.]|nr:hypothetical protein [Caldithrix sp.]